MTRNFGTTTNYSIFPRTRVAEKRLQVPRAGCTGTFMRENAIGKHRRDSTYTVSYVPADWICAARDHESRLIRRAASLLEKAHSRIGLKAIFLIPHPPSLIPLA